MKYEWRKTEKQRYIPKQKPELIQVPKMKFITISGSGNPNGETFKSHIEALYGPAYAIRMLNKSENPPADYFEYIVYPLEGIWDLSDKAKASGIFDKNELVYKIMIRQPDFVTPELFDYAITTSKSKKDNPLYDEVVFEEIEDGLCVQMLHVGSYDDEAKTFEVMQKFIDDNHLELTTKVHREIYLSDFRRVAPEKLKTVLRYFVKHKS